MEDAVRDDVTTADDDGDDDGDGDAEDTCEGGGEVAGYRR